MAICMKPDGTRQYVAGDTCPVGTVPFTSEVGSTQPGVATTDGKLPGNADKRLIGVQRYVGSQLQTTSDGTVYQAVKDFERLKVTNPDIYRSIVSSMRQAGLLTSREKSDATILRKYRLLVDASAESVAEGQPQTPMQIINSLIERGGPPDDESATGRTRAYSGPTYSVSLTNETEAYTLLNDMARDMIGRDLTEEEIAKYTRKLNKAEAAAPRVTTPQGQAGTVYSGGVDRNEVVRQLITDNPDYAGFQLNHQVMDTILAELDEGQAFLNEWS